MHFLAIKAELMSHFIIPINVENTTRSEVFLTNFEVIGDMVNTALIVLNLN